MRVTPIVVLALWAISPVFAEAIVTDLGQWQLVASAASLEDVTSASSRLQVPSTVNQEFLVSASSAGWDLSGIWNDIVATVSPASQEDAPGVGADDTVHSGSFLGSALMTCAMFLQFAFIRRQSIGDFLILNGICGLYGFAVFLLKHRTQAKVVRQC